MSVQEMHTKAEIDYLEVRQKKPITLMMDRCKDNQYLDNTERTTRQRNAVILRIPQAKTNKLLRAPIFKGSTLWNKQPIQIRNANNRLELKKSLKTSD
jgi:hypothetical protein